MQGSILTDSFSEVWKNKFEYFRNRPLPEKCKGCEYETRCKGDSLHTMDFEKNEPKFCYRDYMQNPGAETYKNELFTKYPGVSFSEISSDENTGHEIIIEPDAFKSIKQYFHIGSKNPISMYEQQMALIGFTSENTDVVRYVIPCDGAFRVEDNAIFSKRIMKTVDKELKIINNNYYESSDRSLCGSECSNKKPMKFIGFIHSHPTQSELQYSIGDDRIHKKMFNLYGSYTGILVNPAESTLGAYYGKDIVQTKLIIPEV